MKRKTEYDLFYNSKRKKVTVDPSSVVLDIGSRLTDLNNDESIRSYGLFIIDKVIPFYIQNYKLQLDRLKNVTEPLCKRLMNVGELVINKKLKFFSYVGRTSSGCHRSHYSSMVSLQEIIEHCSKLTHDMHLLIINYLDVVFRHHQPPKTQSLNLVDPILTSNNEDNLYPGNERQENVEDQTNISECVWYDLHKCTQQQYVEDQTKISEFCQKIEKHLHKTIKTFKNYPKQFTTLFLSDVKKSIIKSKHDLNINASIKLIKKELKIMNSIFNMERCAEQMFWKLFSSPQFINLMKPVNQVEEENLNVVLMDKLAMMNEDRFSKFIWKEKKSDQQWLLYLVYDRIRWWFNDFVPTHYDVAEHLYCSMSIRENPTNMTHNYAYPSFDNNNGLHLFENYTIPIFMISSDLHQSHGDWVNKSINSCKISKESTEINLLGIFSSNAPIVGRRHVNRIQKSFLTWTKNTQRIKRHQWFVFTWGWSKSNGIITNEFDTFISLNNEKTSCVARPSSLSDRTSEENLKCFIDKLTSEDDIEITTLRSDVNTNPLVVQDLDSIVYEFTDFSVDTDFDFNNLFSARIRKSKLFSNEFDVRHSTKYYRYDLNRNKPIALEQYVNNGDLWKEVACIYSTSFDPDDRIFISKASGFLFICKWVCINSGDDCLSNVNFMLQRLNYYPKWLYPFVGFLVEDVKLHRSTNKSNIWQVRRYYPERLTIDEGLSISLSLLASYRDDFVRFLDTLMDIIIDLTATGLLINDFEKFFRNLRIDYTYSCFLDSLDNDYILRSHNLELDNLAVYNVGIITQTLCILFIKGTKFYAEWNATNELFGMDSSCLYDKIVENCTFALVDAGSKLVMKAINSIVDHIHDYRSCMNMKTIVIVNNMPYPNTGLINEPGQKLDSDRDFLLQILSLGCKNSEYLDTTLNIPRNTKNGVNEILNHLTHVNPYNNTNVYKTITTNRIPILGMEFYDEVGTGIGVLCDVHTWFWNKIYDHYTLGYDSGDVKFTRSYLFEETETKKVNISSVSYLQFNDIDINIDCDCLAKMVVQTLMIVTDTHNCRAPIPFSSFFIKAILRPPEKEYDMKKLSYYYLCMVDESDWLECYPTIYSYMEPYLSDPNQLIEYCYVENLNVSPFLEFEEEKRCIHIDELKAYERAKALELFVEGRLKLLYKLGKAMEKYLPRIIDWRQIHPNAFKSYFCKTTAVYIDAFLSHISIDYETEKNVALPVQSYIKSTMTDFFKGLDEEQIEKALYTWTGMKVLPHNKHMIVCIDDKCDSITLKTCTLELYLPDYIIDLAVVDLEEDVDLANGLMEWFTNCLQTQLIEECMIYNNL